VAARETPPVETLKESIMTKLSVLAAIALASSTIYAHSCDRGIHAAANATPIVACNSSECAIDESVTPQQPVATPETAAPKIALRAAAATPLTTHRRQRL
jgi:hypothetical protein